MEKSKNYNFNLPNSANDEIANINDISDNFRIIDEKLKIDQTYSPESENAQSGVAVAEAVEHADTLLRQDISEKLPKNPTDWEPWTAEEQAAARERIGIDETFESIEKFTVDEESVLYVTRDAEPDGTAYYFKKVMVRIKSYDTNMSGLCRVVFGHRNDNRKFDSEYSAMFFNSGYNKTYVFCEKRNGFWLTEAILSHTNAITRSVCSDVDTDNTVFNLITGLKIQFNNSFIVGTEIEIFGVRA